MSDLFKNINHFYGPVPFSIEIIDEAGKIVYVNEAFTKLWGFQFNELLEYNFFEDPEIKRRGIQNKITHIYNDLDNPRLVINGFVDSLLKRRDSTLPILRTKLFPIFMEDNRYIVLFHQDQTEEVLNEAEIKKAREGNKEAERLKDTFLNVLSHELRTPLNIVLGYSSIIKESMKDKIGAEDRVYLDNLYSGSERLFKSITQMLEFAQIEAGSFKMSPEVFDLIPLLFNSLSLISKESEKKDIKIKTSVKRSSIFVNADLQCTENAINNLLNNAIKFTKQGFIELEIDVIEKREVAICKIKDTGIGISTEYLDHLFRPFSQEDLKIGRNFEGNGLGLALSKRYIEKMGGSLLVDSIKGVGSTFTFTLPLAHTDYKKTDFKNTIVNLKKVFLIDSERDSLELLNAFLKNRFSIDSSSFNSFDLSSLQNENYELIIVDVDQSYWEESLKTCTDIKNIKNTPIIVLSSEFMDERIKMFYTAGADKVLIKPFSKVELLKIIGELIDIKPATNITTK